MTSAALGVLVWKHPLADAAQKTAAGLGAAFTFVCLITGSLWGKPMWGTYWVWDARLTSMLVLFLLYLGLIAVRQTMDDTPRGARIASIMTIVGAIDIPIIKYSVDWWNTLHQPASVFRMGGPTISASMLWPLLVTDDETMRPLALGLASFSSEAGTQFNLYMAAAAFTILPVIVLFLFVQKQFIEGIARTGIK